MGLRLGEGKNGMGLMENIGVAKMRWGAWCSGRWLSCPRVEAASGGCICHLVFGFGLKL